MKHSLFVLFFLILVSSHLSSQTPVPRYVVIGDAESEISELETKNSDMERSNSVFEDQNRILNSKIEASETFIGQADGMIDRLSATMGELYTLLQTIVDTETRRELQKRMDENRQARYDLENRKRRELELINVAREQIENNRKLIAVNRIRSKANDQRIGYLRACIELSLNENRGVESVLQDADRVRQEVERLLNQ